MNRNKSNKATYLCNCRKCTYKYYGFYDNEPAEWCKAIVDQETNLILHDENYPEMYFTCDKFTVENRQLNIKLN